jgi:hypothetical protein
MAIDDEKNRLEGHSKCLLRLIMKYKRQAVIDKTCSFCWF